MTDELASIAAALVAPGKGILAADESTGTIKKRFDSIRVESTEETRRGYRDFLLTAEGAAEHISGVILYDETIRQSSATARRSRRCSSGRESSRASRSTRARSRSRTRPDETVTEGLDGLRDRLAEYHELGARFTKWRAVITIGDAIPSEYCIWTNAHALARFAALSQEAGLVPIVEPEVLMDGDHTIERSFDVTSRDAARGVHGAPRPARRTSRACC